MRLTRWLGPASFLVGIAILALAVVRGEGNVYLVLVIPVIVATGPLAFLGIILIFAGFLLTFGLWPFRHVVEPRPPGVGPTSKESPPPARRWGGVVFLGPIPVVFGSDPKMTRTMLLVGVVLFLALLALTVIVLLA